MQDEEQQSLVTPSVQTNDYHSTSKDNDDLQDFPGNANDTQHVHFAGEASLPPNNTSTSSPTSHHSRRGSLLESSIGLLLTSGTGNGFSEQAFQDFSRSTQTLLLSLFIIGFYLLCGVIGFSILSPRRQEWTTIDCLYFTVVTFTTTGYGDLHPVGDGERIFCMVFLILGVLILGGVVLGLLFDNFVETFDEWRVGATKSLDEEFLDRFESKSRHSPMAGDRSRRLEKASSFDSSDSSVFVSKEESKDLGEEEVAVDDDNEEEATFFDAHQDLLEPPSKIVDSSSSHKNLISPFWQDIGRELYNRIAFHVGLVLLSIYLGYLEGWTVLTSVYYAVVTATSVGYGDVVPVTPNGKIFAIFFIPLSVAIIAETFGRLTGVFLKYKTDQAEREFLNRRFTQADLDAMDRDCNGEVDYEEFVRFMLVSMGKVTMEDMDRLKSVYDALDVDHDGSLQLNDLILMAQSENATYGK